GRSFKLSKCSLIALKGTFVNFQISRMVIQAILLISESIFRAYAIQAENAYFSDRRKRIAGKYTHRMRRNQRFIFVAG
ncbi:MAG TPA: hypothetical protein DEP46_05465, partial [Blastocatellia bacterium]|nr:hypothetical protein [Blastocatellia bacterium]